MRDISDKYDETECRRPDLGSGPNRPFLDDDPCKKPSCMTPGGGSAIDPIGGP